MVSAAATDRPATARQITDAVLYEGYVLFPYRASALKNRYRWQWGVVIPQAQVDIGGSEPSELPCEVLLRAAAGTDVTVTARFLHLRLRQMVDADGTEVDELDIDGEPVPTWEEGLEHEVTCSVTLGHRRTWTRRFALDAAREVEDVGGAGQAVRTTWAVAGELQVTVDPAGAGRWRVRTALRNVTPWSQHRAAREDVLRRSLVGVHVLLEAHDGAFASVIDPPHWADGIDEPRNRGLHPVLVGDAEDQPGSTEHGADARPPPAEGTVDAATGQAELRRSGSMVLAAPIILYDHPQVAPESPGPSFDATEVDELLALAVMGLTDDEKRRARATDPRAAELIDRTDHLPPSVQERLHGTVRQLRPADLRPEPAAGVTDEVRDLLGVGEEPVTSAQVGAVDVEVGDHVRLRPSRRADAHDLFVAGRVALIERIVRTVDGETWLAVTVTDDPAAELDRWYGRFRYFGVDEVEPLSDAPTATPATDPAAGPATHEGG